jgi:WhiB family redox-sensing transcriptional regulator
MRFPVQEAQMAAVEPFVTTVPDSPLWADHAVCKGRTTLFFAPRAERPQARVRREAQARLLCQTCPVQLDCRSFARLNHEYGFWGGESEEDRHLAGFTVAAPIGVRARRTPTDMTVAPIAVTEPAAASR